ncbi:MAG: hypothetical protein ACK2TT_04120 [Anaerolineales bacterium]|jgi:hypothetical protein
MKTSKVKILLALLMTLPIILLTACENYDLRVAEQAFMYWAEHNDMYENGSYKPAGVVTKAIENTIGDITNREENVQFDGLDVIRDIEKADSLASEALEDFDTSKISSAVSIRPLDWRLHEQEGVVWLANGNGAAAESAFTQSDELLRESLLHGGDCASLRRSQLEVRLDTVWDAIFRYEEQPGRKQGDAVELRAQLSAVKAELYQLNLNRSEFCDLHGND